MPNTYADWPQQCPASNPMDQSGPVPMTAWLSGLERFDIPGFSQHFIDFVKMQLLLYNHLS
jgi:hypothetical protein